jgi:predicted NUDIX family phosphoesterase
MDIHKEKKAKIASLEKLAEKVLKLKRESIPRRPLVIEFCGAPKSGKSSCISSLELFLRRNGFKTRVLTERASVCPVKNKFSPLFNFWTVCSALVELVEILSNHSKDNEIIILDRGIFDGLCWFNFLKDRGNLSEENFYSFENFLTMNKLKSVIDLVYIFTAEPSVSLEREYANLLTEKTGSIMKPVVLEEFKQSIVSSAQKYSKIYRRIEMFDTSSKDQNQVSFEVTTNILNILQDTIEEKIAYFPRHRLSDELPNAFSFTESGLVEVTLQYGPREEIEADSNCVQPIPIVVVRDKNSDRLLIVKKNKARTSESSPESNKLLFYLGGHVREEDQHNSSENAFLAIAKYALTREVEEEIGLSFVPESDDTDPLCIWIRDNERSKKHLAICFIYKADIDTLKFKLDANEFIVTGKTKSGSIMHVSDALKKPEDVEGWSEIIGEKIFGISNDQMKFDLS